MIQQPSSPFSNEAAIPANKTRVLNASVALSGKSINLNFADGSHYRFHTAWIKDSNPRNVGVDEYRTPAHVFQLAECKAVDVAAVADGNEVEVSFNDGSIGRFGATWLRATAPFVAKLLDSSRKLDADNNVKLHGTGMMQGPEKVGWRAEGFKIPEFQFSEITRSLDTHIAFLQCVLFEPGVATIHGVPAPDDYDSEIEAGAPLEKAVFDLIGRFNQHTIRRTAYSVTHAKAGIDGEVEREPLQKSMDYDNRYNLPMHTDHSQFPGMPGYLQFMQNLQGPVDSFVCDGLAIARFMEKNFPEQYKLLTSVPITHSFRNKLYTQGGKYRDILLEDDSADPVGPYEVCHTHPVIMLDKDGELERIAQSETKRGVCAIPYDIYEQYMKAYTHWMALVEDPEFVHKFHWPENGVVVCNNFRVLHGRAEMADGGERLLIVGYTGKSITDNRYRLLCQLRAQRDQGYEDDPSWLSRLPNQVLSKMIMPSKL